MKELGEYLIHLTAAALICGVAIRFVRGNQMISIIIKLICGVFLAYSLIKPVPELRIKQIDNIVSDIGKEGERFAAEGMEYTRTALSESITQRTEAYIMEKAKAMHADLAVEVELSDDDIPIPVAVSLTGDVAPYTKSQLSELISTDLDIPKEKQQWILP